MRGEASAYAILELQPGADPAAVEAAYRRLIKLHHPDRDGGDASRAAEINRAYFELRRLSASSRESFQTYSAPYHSPRRRTGRRRRRQDQARLWVSLMLALSVLGFLQQDRLSRESRRWVNQLAEVGALPVSNARSKIPVKMSSFDAPLAENLVDSSISDAIRLMRSGDQNAVVERSRDCHRRMRAAPDLDQFDGCAAFDSAVASLEDRDPDRDNGPFSASSVTARQMTAASLLSNDYLAIERRLNRIRNRVELTLSPPPSIAAAAEVPAGIEP